MAYDYKDKITMKFNVNQLERIIIALLNSGYNKKFASNVKRLFDLFNPNLYKADYEKEVRVYLIKEIVNIILENNIEDKNSILAYLDTDGKYYNDSVEILNNLVEYELCDEELNLLDKNISNQLRYSAIMEKTDTLNDKLINLKAENYDDLETAVVDIEKDLTNITRDIKSARESIENSKNDLNLSSNSFISTIGQVIKEERNPAMKVKTGIQYLNSMLNGGFERGRVYCAMGVAKGWKSGFLLNCASWAKRYNSFTTEPGMKPVVVYLSMENSNKETLVRFWNHCFGDNDNIANHSEVEAARMLENAGLFTPNNPEAPELLVWYRSNRSINTADLSVMLEDLKRENKQCVFLVLDYLKRIRATESNKDVRLELANVTNELKSIATEQDIPIVTAMQLNREAFRALEEAETFEEKLKASDRLGASNVGESIDIVQNADFSFIVNQMFNRKVNDDGDIDYTDHYLYIKLIACRTKQPAIISFKHRFRNDNGMALDEDIMSPTPRSTITDVDLIKERTSMNAPRTKGSRTIA